MNIQRTARPTLLIDELHLLAQPRDAWSGRSVMNRFPAVDHRVRLLEYGPSGRLAILAFESGEVEVLPLNDDEALDSANPIGQDGKVRLDAGKIEARNDTRVKLALKSGPVSLVILGGSHDLSANGKKVGGGKVEYSRVIGRRFKEVAGAGRLGGDARAWKGRRRSARTVQNEYRIGDECGENGEKGHYSSREKRA